MQLDGWGEFLAAIVVFLMTHAIPPRPPVKTRMVAALGQRGYGALYGTISVLTLVWLIVAARRAPFVPLSDLTTWQLAAPFVLMAPACLIATFAVARPNPYSFGGTGNERYDPRYPGVLRLTRHPFLAAIALWSLGHALANPDAAHAILFGGFLALALLSMPLIDRRNRDKIVSPPRHPVAPMTATEIAARALAASGLYAAAILAHPFLAGIAVLPVLRSMLGLSF